MRKQACVFSLSLSNQELYARDKLSAIIENCNGKTWSRLKKSIVRRFQGCTTTGFNEFSGIRPEFSGIRRKSGRI